MNSDSTKTADDALQTPDDTRTERRSVFRRDWICFHKSLAEWLHFFWNNQR